MNVDITKFLASSKGKRFVKQAHAAVVAQMEKEKNHVRLALIINRAHPDYRNGK